MSWSFEHSQRVSAAEQSCRDAARDGHGLTLALEAYAVELGLACRAAATEQLAGRRRKLKEKHAAALGLRRLGAVRFRAALAIVAERALAEADGDLATGRGGAAEFAAFGITSDAGPALLEHAPSRVRLRWSVAAAAPMYGAQVG